MSGYFEENKKFFSMKGILNRRDFFVNLLVVELIESILITPIVYLMFFKPEIMQTISSYPRPIGVSLTMVFLGLVNSFLLFPSIVRRIRDIVGEEDDNKISVISAVLTVILFMTYTPVGTTFWGSWLTLFVMVSLLFWQGRISGEAPKNEVVKFNWGAFWGTWIWGLLNKTFVTLWMLPLLFTAGWAPFMLICGLRGNEWAYKKNAEKYTDVTSFHKIQLKQSILLFVLVPIIFFMLLTGMSFLLTRSVALYSTSHPEFREKIEAKFNNYQINSIESAFSKIELGKDEYKFYLDPEDWQSIGNTIKSSVFKNAMSYILIKQGKSSLNMEDYVNSIEEMNKIKIYSEFNNEELASFSLNPDEVKSVYKKAVEKKSYTEIKTLWNSGYKFNDHPTVPDEDLMPHPSPSPIGTTVREKYKQKRA